MPQQKILVLDFGSQYTQLITRAIREQGVYSTQLAWHTDLDLVQEIRPSGVILSGGPASIYIPGAPKFPEYLLDLQVPILGICYGMQALTHALGGKVIPAESREFGQAQLQVSKENILLPAGQHQVWMSHGDRIESLPEGFEILASTGNSPIAAMGDPVRNYYGLQFHPEVKHTSIGTWIIKNFLFQICGLDPSWTAESIIKLSVAEIRNKVGKDRVIAGVSGGVDSTVAAALVHQAVGDQLEAVFVDTGLLRKNESMLVEQSLGKSLNMQLHIVRAAELFFNDLKGVIDPEQKRTLIGNRFIRVFEKKSLELDSPRYLVQGTIYPDVVESAAPDRKESETIKTHHNVGGLPAEMQFTLIEPLRYLF